MRTREIERDREEARASQRERKREEARTSQREREQSQKRQMVSGFLCLTSFIKVESRVSLVVHLFSSDRADARDMTTGLKVDVVHL